MRRLIRTTAALVAVGVALLPAPARAHDLRDRLAEDAHLPEVVRLVRLHGQVHDLLSRYLALESDAGRTWLATAGAMRDAEAAEAAAARAELRLDERIRAAYRMGPATQIEALLGATTLADLALASEYAGRMIAIDATALRNSIVAEAVATAGRAQAEAAHDVLVRRLERMRAMLLAVQAKADEAAALARRARIEDRALEAQRRLVADAVARAGSWDLGVIDYAQDQSHLLALLGPTQGRTCETPEGLVETGEAFDGYASWYGWEFGGQATATGAIFDPRLFTAANRWLPFGTILRVRHGERCALVLVNDRGPYGRLERVIDLSQAAAEHLGVGVSWVHAEILVPRDGLPD
jgi:hypothetical protein